MCTMVAVNIVHSLCLLLCVWRGVQSAYHNFDADSFSTQTREPKLGDTVTLSCNAGGPQTIVGWAANGVNITDLPLAFTTDGNELTISSFSEEYEAIYQCIATDSTQTVGQLSPPILVTAFESRYFVKQPSNFTGYIVDLSSNTKGYEPIAFQCELIKIYNGAKPIITWQVLEVGGTIVSYTTPSDATETRFLMQYDHTGYFQIHSPTRENQNGLQARCIATHPDSPTEMVYSEWADAILLDAELPEGMDLQDGFEPFAQIPPLIYHVEEGQTNAILPCSRVIGIHSHGILWTTENTQHIIFYEEFAFDPIADKTVFLFGNTNLRVQVDNGQFLDQVFICLIQLSDSSEGTASSRIAGPAPLLPSPSFSEMTFSVFGSAGGTVMLHYNITSNDAIQSVWWWKDEALIPSTHSRYLVSIDGSMATLYIQNFVFEDVGVFQVLVVTGSRYMFAGEMGNFEVVDEELPTIRINLATSTSILIGPPSPSGYTCTQSIPNNGQITNSGVLEIDAGPNQNVSGTYSCTSAEIQGNIVITLDAYASAYVVSSSGDVVADEGSSVTLAVIADGIPDTITYVWRKGGVVIPGETSNTLTINPVSISDIGAYECIPSNSEGSFNSSTIQVDVKVPSAIGFSTIMDTSVNQTVAPSSTGGYTCTPSIPNGQLTNSGNLVIDGRLDIGDATEYRCTSDEINGVIVIELAAMASAYVVSSSGDVVADEGSSVTLAVIANGIPDTITYVWRKGGVVIPGETSNTLTINPVSISDIGAYECIPSNSEGSFNSSTMQVDVKVPGAINFSTIMNTSVNQTVAPSSTGGYTCTPSIPNGQLTNSGNLVIDGRLDIGDATEYRCTSDEIKGVIVIDLVAMASAHVVSSTGDVVADEGSSVTLAVIADGIPDTITYVWRKGGVVIPGETSNTLTINPVSISDIGAYECIPSNSEGSFNSSTIQVDVKVPSAIGFSTIMDTSVNQTVAPSSTGGYTCTPSIPNGQLTNSGNLVIDGRLDIGDATEYRCTSDEINGVIVIELAAMASAYVVSSSGDVVADEGSSVTLAVIANGIPDTITYVWRKDGVVIPGETSNTLTINPVSISDIGAYECIPSNSEGSFNSSTIQVDVKVETSAIDSLSTLGYTQSIGLPGNYTCSPTLPNNGTVTATGQLVIQGSLDISDSGQYMCTSPDLTGHIAFNLDVYTFAYISSSTGDVTATAGSSITLEVTAFGVPTPITYQWIKDGVVIPGETSNTLTFDKVNINDIGEYVCIPSNIGGSHNATTMVLSVNAPVVINTPNGVLVRTLAPPAPSGYNCTPSTPRVQLTPDGVLQTRNLQPIDSGTYTCTANNYTEVRGSISFTISVESPAFVTTMPRDIAAKESTTTSLPCNANGDLSTLTYVWKKDGEVIPGANSSYLNIYGTSKLDVGHYECIPSNEYGTYNTTEYILNIEVETTLDWLTEYSLSLLLPVTSPYACTPPLRGASVDNNGVFVTQGLRSSDADRYSCTSEDFNGTIILVLRVQTYTPDPPVLNTPTFTDDLKAIIVSWNVTNMRVKPATQYILFWRAEEENGRQSERKRQSESNSVTVQNTSYNLENYSREAVYTFWIVAENDAGRSELSEVEEFSVDEGLRLFLGASTGMKEAERLAAWAIALIVILCLLCCCICCLLWCILCCCLIGRRKVYHAEEEEKKHSEEMGSYRKKAEDEDLSDVESGRSSSNEQEDEITGDNLEDTPPIVDTPQDGATSIDDETVAPV